MKKILSHICSLSFTVLFFFPIFVLLKKSLLLENSTEAKTVTFSEFALVSLAFFLSYVFSVLLTHSFFKESGPGWQITVEREETSPPSIKEIIEPVVLKKIPHSPNDKRANRKGKSKTQ